MKLSSWVQAQMSLIQQVSFQGAFNSDQLYASNLRLCSEKIIHDHGNYPTLSLNIATFQNLIT